MKFARSIIAAVALSFVLAGQVHAQEIGGETRRILAKFYCANIDDDPNSGAHEIIISQCEHLEGEALWECVDEWQDRFEAWCLLYFNLRHSLD